jgi:hypothetical protein
MSILGVKKKHIDTSEMEKEILKIKSEIITINRKDIFLYKNSNALNLKLLNIENKVNHIKDRKIINISAGIEGPLKLNQLFNFGDGGNSFLLSYPGRILNISLVSVRTGNKDVSITIVLNYKDTPVIRVPSNEIYFYGDFPEFSESLTFKAGDLLRFKNIIPNPGCLNTLVSVIVELIL